MPDVCLVHLVWKPFGPQRLHDFLAAYRATPAGCAHRLVLLFNGFEAAEMEAWSAAAHDLPHERLRLPAPVQDLPAYLEAARRLSCDFLCFCNSYSRPLAPGWLATLYSHASSANVGLVGASGSWESHRTNLGRAYSPRGLARIVMSRLGRGRGVAPGESSGAAAHDAAPSAGTLKRRWRELQRVRRLFPSFPNPHVRTNGMMIRRDLLVALSEPPILDKLDAHAFESGVHGLTAQVQSRGFAIRVVGRDGSAWPPSQWWRSGGYRSGAQENLLIADNRTREYDQLGDGARAHLRTAAWGASPESTERLLAQRER